MADHSNIYKKIEEAGSESYSAITKSSSGEYALDQGSEGNMFNLLRFVKRETPKNVALLSPQAMQKLSDDEILFLRENMNPVPFTKGLIRLQNPPCMFKDSMTADDAEFITRARKNGMAFCTGDTPPLKSTTGKIVEAIHSIGRACYLTGFGGLLVMGATIGASFMTPLADVITRGGAFMSGLGYGTAVVATLTMTGFLLSPVSHLHTKMLEKNNENEGGNAGNALLKQLEAKIEGLSGPGQDLSQQGSVFTTQPNLRAAFAENAPRAAAPDKVAPAPTAVAYKPAG